jgi:alkaline phosphatase D
MDRRTFLRLGLGSLAAAAAQPVLVRRAADALPAPGPFGHGVAAGDPLADRAIIWTRVTPSDDAVPGSGLGGATEVTWEVATDPGFATIAARGLLTTAAATDHTVKVDVPGLQPLTDHWYRFGALGATSPVGRFRTLPGPGADVASVRVGVVSCSNYEGGYFSAYRHVAARDDLDLVLHLGDYLYEYGEGAYGPGASFGRSHDPVHEMVTLEDYRRRHALYKTDPDLAALHQRYAMVTTIDDHEVTDNSWSGGAVNHQDGEGDYALRRAAAMQAYFEWMPIRATGSGDGEPTRIYRGASFGALADLFVLDERTYRSRQVQGVRQDMVVTSPEVGDPDRTLLGGEQRAWLESGLDASTAQWKVLANPVMFAPLVLADLLDEPTVGPVVATVLDGLGVSPPVVLNGDQWDGYRAEQASLRDRFGDVGGVVILTGDIHSSWAAEIPADPGAYLPVVGGDSTAVEFVTPGTTSDSFSAAIASLGVPGAEQLSTQLPLLVTTVGPWFKYLDPDRHGYGVFEVTPDAAQYDWYFISDRTDPRATVSDGPSWRTPAGTNKLEPADRLGPRATSSGAVAPAPATEVVGLVRRAVR